MSVYKLFGSGTGGTENSVSSLDIQFDGTIVALHASLAADLDTDLESCNVEASFLSTNTISSNDARGSLIMVLATNSQAAAGTAVVAVNSGIGGLSILVTAGERVHLHFNASAGVTSNSHIYLYVNDGQPPEVRRRR